MRGRIVCGKARLDRLHRRDVDAHAAYAELVHLRQQRVRRILVHVHDAAAACEPDLAHRVEHAGIVAAIGARLHEHEALDAEMPRERRDNRRAGRAAARSAASRSRRRADSAPPVRTRGNARRRRSAACGRRAPARSRDSLDGDLRARDDVAPHIDLARDVARDLVRRGGDGDGGLLLERLAQPRLGAGAHDFAIEPRDDRLRRRGGRCERKPVRHIEARLAGLGEGRHVGQQRTARARDAEAEQCAGLDLRQAGGEAADRHVDAAADHLADRRRDAAERHVQRLHAGDVEEQLHRHMRRRAGPAGAERELARLLLAERHQFGERAHAEAGARHQ